VHPKTEGCLESAWRRVHRSAIIKDPELHAVSSTSEAMLANAIVFEWLKSVTGVTQSELNNKVYLLDLETMEGSWHPFLPHPLLNGRPSAEWVHTIDLWLDQGQGTKGSSELMSYFSQLTSPVTGIFHRWDEGELKQLPLCLCIVQAVDPLSEGPAELLPEIVCPGLTHVEARIEAGLVGLESYVSRMADLYLTKPPLLQGSGGQSQEFEYIGVGAGETLEKGVCRGLEKWLTEAMVKQLKAGEPEVSRVNLSTVEDQTCRHYLRVLTIMHEETVIGLGEKVAGFPTVWVGTNGSWYGCVGLNRTTALRKALQQALLKAQNKEAFLTVQATEQPSVKVQDVGTQSITIHAVDETEYPNMLQAALQILKRNQKRILVADLTFEPFLKEGLVGAFGVSVREEESL
jgi:putative thiazole-containing bacteriocin maturation protein